MCVMLASVTHYSRPYCPSHPTPLLSDTVYQPNLKKKKTVSTPKPKHFKDKHVRHPPPSSIHSYMQDYTHDTWLLYLAWLEPLLCAPVQSKYLLTHQEQDVKGRTKTRLYKGDILETRGGGHQVRFTGVESLRDGNMSTTSLESNGTRPR